MAENREILRDANLEEKLKELEKHPNVKQKGSQVANFLRLIKMNLKKDAVDARRERTAAAAKQKKEKKKPDIYMKVRYEQYCKLVPVFEGITFLEMEDVLRIEFGIIRYQRMTLVLGKDEVDITDQRSLDFVIDILSKEKGDHTIVVTPNSAILPPMTDAGAEKLDALLRRLDHAQLRVLLRDSIDQGADLSKPIREYITLNRKCKAEYNPAQSTSSLSIHSLVSHIQWASSRVQKVSSTIQGPQVELLLSVVARRDHFLLLVALVRHFVVS